MSPDEQAGLKSKIEIYQNILNLFRDFVILGVFFLLFFFPKFINKILISAGFVEGELIGFKWESQFEETDRKLIEAAEQINILEEQLNESNNIISKLEDEIEIDDRRIADQINTNEEAVQQASSLNSEIQNTLKENTPLLNPRVDVELTSLVEIVNNYKIQIFYNSNKPEQKEVALGIQNALQAVGVKSTIQVLPQQDRASSDQIRYFAETEREVAYALQNILSQTYSERRFNLQTVYTPSPGSVSIFLKT